jgi:hypothetical protein
MRKVIGGLMLLATAPMLALPWDAAGVHTTISTSASVTDQVARQHAERVLQWFNAVSTDPKLFSRTSLGQYFSDKVRYRVNGVLAADGIEALYKRCQHMLKGLQHYQVVFPLRSVVASQHLAAVTYRLNTVLADGHAQDNLITVTMHFQQGKVDSWNAVIETIKQNKPQA